MTISNYGLIRQRCANDLGFSIELVRLSVGAIEDSHPGIISSLDLDQALAKMLFCRSAPSTAAHINAVDFVKNEINLFEVNYRFLLWQKETEFFVEDRPSEATPGKLDSTH